MYIYRGVKYNPKDLAKQSKKPAKTERVYRGQKYVA